MSPEGLWPWIWIVDLRQGLVNKVELPVTFGLLSKTEKSGGQIFKLGAQLCITFDVGSGQELKSFGPITVPRDHAEALCLFT